jgi:hypothetical protein
MDPVENVTLGERVRRSKYGLGDRRSFAQLMEFSGVDPIHKATLRDRCGNIEYVPFKEHPLGPDYIPRFDEVTYAPLDEPDEGSIYYQPPPSLPAAVSAGAAVRKRTSEEKDKLFEKRNYLINHMKEKKTLDLEQQQQQQLQQQAKNINENIWFDILMELSLFFIILIGCYYCTMLPSRSTKNL